MDPANLLQLYAPRVPGVCEPWCGRSEQHPLGCLGFGAKGTKHCDCVVVDEDCPHENIVDAECVDCGANATQGEGV